MTIPDKHPNLDERGSVRPVIEHALIVYGYSPEVARALLDRLAVEARAE